MVQPACLWIRVYQKREYYYAKIIELIADKIETGNLIADLQVKSKLWYGFNQPNGDF